MMTDLKQSCKKVNMKGLIFLGTVHYYSAYVYMASVKTEKACYIFITFLSIFYLLSIFIYCLFLHIFIGVQLLYNVVLLSAVQQSESAICIHISPYTLPIAPLSILISLKKLCEIFSL